MKAKHLLLLLLLLFIACNYNATGINDDFTMNYKYGAFSKFFITVTDKDDIKKVRNWLSSILQMEEIQNKYSIELIMLRSGGIKKNKKIGLIVFKVEISDKYVHFNKTKDMLQCVSSINPTWFNLNFNNTISTNSLQINNREFLLIERYAKIENTELKELLAFTIEKNHLYIFELYSKVKNYEKSSKILMPMLKTISFNKGDIDESIKKSKAGFFTGLWHGAFWIIRWIYSWAHYYDVWADYNTGFGYIFGFIIGLVVFGGGFNLFGGGGKKEY